MSHVTIGNRTYVGDDTMIKVTKKAAYIFTVFKGRGISVGKWNKERKQWEQLHWFGKLGIDAKLNMWQGRDS